MRTMPASGTQAIAVARSGNSKIGDAATTYVEQRSCPSSCRFKDGGGCYAEAGALGKFVTGPLNQAAQLVDDNVAAIMAALSEAEAIDELEIISNRPLRLHTVGDCSTDLAARIVAAASERYMARGGGPVWTYTHAWRQVARASWGKVSVLASCETVQDGVDAHERGYATSIVVEAFAGERRYTLSEREDEPADELASSSGAEAGAFGGDSRRPRPAGVAASRSLSVVPCPQQTRGVSCTDCRLCMDDQARVHAGVTIGFAVHGTALAVRRATMALNDPDDPDRRLSSRVLIPRVEKRWVELYGRLPSTGELAKELRMNPSSVAQMRQLLAAEAA